MSFWVEFGERWSRKQAEREKKDKEEKAERKAARKELRDQAKELERLIKEIRDGAEDEVPWWFENICQCLEILQEQVDYLLKREEKDDEP